MTTRQRITLTSIGLFNDRGYHGPTLADIAQKCGMSRGNMAYHYKGKEALLDDIAVLLEKEIQDFQRNRKGYPAFSNLRLDMRSYAVLQDSYPFIFRDTSVLEHESIRNVMSTWSKKTITYNMEAFAFAIEIGNMRPEQYKGLYRHLAINAWLITYYWISQKVVRQSEAGEDAEKIVWSTILPHFTDKGINAFVSYFGSDYLSQLGIPLHDVVPQKNIF